MELFWIALTGLTVSFVFSMVGSGGSQIMVPILFWIGLDFKTGAIPLALLESAVTCLSAGFIYLRRGLVERGVAVPVAITVIIGTPLGVLAHSGVSRTSLMIVFAIINIAIGLVVLRGRSLVKETAFEKSRTGIIIAMMIGLGVGFFIGMIGRDGAPFVMVALVLVGFEAREAAGTAAVIVATGCLVAFFIHLPGASTTWQQILVATLSCLVGSQVGSRVMSERLDSKTVRRIFAAAMVVTGAIILIQAF